MSLATLNAQLACVEQRLDPTATRATSYPHAPTRRASAPLPTPTQYRDYHRACFSTAIKSVDMDVSRSGIITAYLTVYKAPDGSDFVDDYGDVVMPGSFDTTLQQLDKERKSRNSAFYCADLFQHNPNEPIGGITRFANDSRGVIYEAKLAMNVRRAQEVYELAKENMIGSSFGYHATKATHKGGLRYLSAIDLIEVSQVTFPANQYAPIISVKSGQWATDDELTPDQICWRRYQTYRRHALAEAAAMKSAFRNR